MCGERIPFSTVYWVYVYILDAGERELTLKKEW